MRIRKDLAKILRSLENRNNSPYRLHLEKMNATEKYYDSKREKLIINEKELISRYNYLHNRTNASSLSLNSLLASIFCGVVATLVCMMAYGSPDKKGTLDILTEAFSNLSNDKVFLGAPLSQQAIVLFVLLAISLILIIMIAAFVMIQAFSMSTSFKENKLEYDLCIFEMRLIKEILDEVYGAAELDSANDPIKENSVEVVLNMPSKEKNSFWGTVNGQTIKLIVFAAIFLSVLSHLFKCIGILIFCGEILILCICLMYIFNLPMIQSRRKSVLLKIKSYRKKNKQNEPDSSQPED